MSDAAITQVEPYNEYCFPQERKDKFEKDLCGKTAGFALSIIAIIAVVIVAIVLTSIFSPAFVAIAILGGSIGLPLLFGLALGKLKIQMENLKVSIAIEEQILLRARVPSSIEVNAIQHKHDLVSYDARDANEYHLEYAKQQKLNEYNIENLLRQTIINERNTAITNFKIENQRSLLANPYHSAPTEAGIATIAASFQPRIDQTTVRLNLIKQEHNDLVMLVTDSYADQKEGLMTQLTAQLERATAIAAEDLEVKHLRKRIEVLADETIVLKDGGQTPQTFATTMKIVNLTLRIQYFQGILQDPRLALPKFEVMYEQDFKDYSPDQMRSMVNGRLPYCTFKGFEERAVEGEDAEVGETEFVDVSTPYTWADMKARAGLT